MANNVNTAFAFGSTMVGQSIFFPGGFFVSDEHLGVIIDPSMGLLEALVQALSERWPALDSAISLKKLVQAEIDKKKADAALIVKPTVCTSKLGETKAPAKNMSIAEWESDMNMAYLAAVTDLAAMKVKLEKDLCERTKHNPNHDLKVQSFLQIMFPDLFHGNEGGKVAPNSSAEPNPSKPIEIETMDIRSRKRFENDVEMAKKDLSGALHEAKRRTELDAAHALLTSRFNQKHSPMRLIGKISNVHPQLFEQACVLAGRPEKNLFQMKDANDGNIYATLKWKDDHAEAFFMNSGPIKAHAFDTMTEALNAVLRKYW